MADRALRGRHCGRTRVCKRCNDPLVVRKPVTGAAGAGPVAVGSFPGRTRPRRATDAASEPRRVTSGRYTMSRNGPNKPETGALPARHRSYGNSRNPFGVMYGLACWVVFCLAGTFVWPAILLLPKLSWRWKITRATAKMLCRCLALPFATSGAPLMGTPCVYVANHASFLDAFAVGLMFPEPVVFVAGGVLSRQRIVGRFLRRIGVVFVKDAEGRGRPSVEADPRGTRGCCAFGTVSRPVPRGRPDGHSRTSPLPSRRLRRRHRDSLSRCSDWDPRDASDSPGGPTASPPGRHTPDDRRAPAAHRRRMEGRPSLGGEGAGGSRGAPRRGLKLSSHLAFAATWLEGDA